MFINRKILVILLLLVNCAAEAQVNNFLFFENHTDSINIIEDIPWSVVGFNKDKSVEAKHLFLGRFSTDPFLQYATQKSRLTINPHVNFSTTHLFDAAKNFNTAGGGLHINFETHSKWSVDAEAYIYKNDNYLIDEERISNNLIPGVLWSTSRSNGFIGANLKSRVAYRPSKYFQFEMGIDNHFVGDGYHSVFLGNTNTPHPFAQISTSFWKIDYSVAYHLLSDVRWPKMDQTYRKYMTSHQFNLKIHRTFNIYIYEAVIWKAEDSVTNRGYDMSYLNPIIFFRPVEFNLGNPSPDNVLMGIGMRWQPKRWVRFYGQVLIDEFYLKEIKARNGWWANKFAMQAGLMFKANFNHHALKFRGEFNMARPFTYSHIQSMQNYGSGFYPLAHPLGANFREILCEAHWEYKRLSLLIQMAFVGVGVDVGSENLGQNIYRSYTDRQSEYGHDWLQGNFQGNVSGDLRLSYLLNEPSSLTISAGVRKVSQFITDDTRAKEFTQIYVWLATFLLPTQKQMYNTSTLFR